MVTVSCSINQSSKEVMEYSLPVKVGDEWKRASEKLGTPDRSGINYFTFYRFGIIVYTDVRRQKITSIIATWFEGGVHFTGKLYGIGLGDTLPKCRRLWGKEESREAKAKNYYRVVWKLGKRTLDLEFWSQGGFDLDLGGEYEADTVKRIQIT